jgi:hypothetical protein
LILVEFAPRGQPLDLRRADGNPAYNLVIGNGSLDIQQFMQATKLPAAGAPGTASNP